MFEINIGTIENKKNLKLEDHGILELSDNHKKTILELQYYRNKIGLFPWGYNDLIKDLRLQYNFSL
jgi:hypothetical protein